MSSNSSRRLRHLILDGVTEAEQFRSPQQGGRRPSVPERNRDRHGTVLQRQLHEIRLNRALVEEDISGLGIQVEFESFPAIELAFESLARERSGIELLNVREDGNITLATVIVPDGKLEHFENLVRDYLEYKQDRRGRARDNRRLIDAIRSIRSATLKALWTDQETFPDQEHVAIWWEVWIRLPSSGERDASISSFRERALALDMRVAQGEVIFPERAVLLVHASVMQMQRSVYFLSHIAELKNAKETADFFDSMSAIEQSEWLDDLLGRTSIVRAGQDVPYVCLLDTGVNRGHPLLEPALASEDVHTVDPTWGTDDTHGHGTEMAGLALAGNLAKVLAGNMTLDIVHRLESVKLLPRDGATGTDPDHHGYLTQEATARAEVTAPLRRRVLGMAVTARDNRDRGAPSAWSAAVDSLAADASGLGCNRRLLVVAAGNADDDRLSDYPVSNDTDGIHDPAQAWNALTVGASTSLVRITEEDAEGFQPIAPRGGLSPFSTTSMTWARHLPLKPDIVLEGGNAAKDSLSAVRIPSLSLLTTCNRPTERLFTTSNATSAATALASRMAAQIMAEYPELWPETVRALMIHSAEWTDTMKNSCLPAIPSKHDYENLLRRCGFGVPDISRALWTATNSLTMVVQASMRPFKKEDGDQPATREMHIHQLPWPRETLEDLGETQVEMRVTLSYFIEPNPSRRGRSRYRYESHGLRFDVRRPLESLDVFRRRINAVARDDAFETERRGDDPLWLIGKRGRHRGSVHGDIWRGSAADLASRGYIGVYPAIGWWKTRSALKQFDRETRYSLLISIRSPEADVNLYAEVTSQIPVEIEPEV